LGSQAFCQIEWSSSNVCMLCKEVPAIAKEWHMERVNEWESEVVAQIRLSRSSSRLLVDHQRISWRGINLEGLNVKIGDSPDWLALADASREVKRGGNGGSVRPAPARRRLNSRLV
jgi:hypothetical protein